MAAMLCARRLLRLARRSPPLPPARGYADPAGGPAAMAFTFASPTQVFYNGANVKQVDVPTLTGSFGILASHVPTLQVLRPGVVTVHAEDGTATKYFVSSGSVSVHALHGAGAGRGGSDHGHAGPGYCKIQPGESCVRDGSSV
uniref:ATP synthase F(1) complex subunit delta, mitochondrial n=1 Tax=Taeniopygia guttata TaxID=59729 RepID=A0A674HL62_TAEGU